MATTIQITEQLQKELTKKKLYGNETYEEVIWDLIEDTLEISEETKKEIEQARADYKAGRTHTLAEVKKKFGI